MTTSDLPLDELCPSRADRSGDRRGHRSGAMSDLDLDAGSLSPWDPNGMSIFQLRAGQDLAEAQGRTYDDHGAVVSG